MTKSLGFIETRGKTALLSSIDEMLNGANIELLKLIRYGSGYHTAAISGKLEDVTSAIDTGKKTVNSIHNNTSDPVIARESVGSLISSLIIARSNIDIMNIFFNKRNVHQPARYDSVGILDSRGLIALIAAADRITKMAPVRIYGYYKMGSGRLSLVFAGDLTSINKSVACGEDIVKKHGKFIGSSIINNPQPQLYEFFH